MNPMYIKPKIKDGSGRWPLAAWSMKAIPCHTNDNPLAYGALDRHGRERTSIGLRCEPEIMVFSMYPGKVIEIERDMTSGDTINEMKILVDSGKYGIISYIHIRAHDDIKVGTRVHAGEYLGRTMACLLNIEQEENGEIVDPFWLIWGAFRQLQNW